MCRPKRPARVLAHLVKGQPGPLAEIELGEVVMNVDRQAQVAADDLTAFIDLAGLGPGQYSLTVHADSSRDAGVTRVTPDAVQVRVTSGKQ